MQPPHQSPAIRDRSTQQWHFTCWVKPGGRRRQRPVRGRLPRPGQQRPNRALAPAGRWHLGAIRRYRLDGFYAIALTTIVGILQRIGHRPTLDLVLKVLEHLAEITKAMNDQGLWERTKATGYTSPLPVCVIVPVNLIVRMRVELVLPVVGEGTSTVPGHAVILAAEGGNMVSSMAGLSTAARCLCGRFAVPVAVGVAAAIVAPTAAAAAPAGAAPGSSRPSPSAAGRWGWRPTR